ncbi:hypothetical protein LXL04_010248 [Taraxacum kok-saghyz]
MENARSNPFLDGYKALLQEPLPEAKDDINSAYSFSVEAACINRNFSQQLLGTNLSSFLVRFNLNTSNMWGIVKAIVDLCMKLNEGIYVCVGERFTEASSEDL